MSRTCRWLTLRYLAVAALTVAMVGVVDQSAAQAEPSPSPSDGNATTIDGSQLTVEYILSVNLQAKVIRPNVVEVGPGVAVILPPKGDGRLSADYCPEYNLCIWEHSYGQGFGAGLAFYRCSAPNQVVDLMSMRYPDGKNVGSASGPKWNDRVSSYSNNQSSGTHSWFVNWVGSRADIVRDSFAPDYYHDLYFLNINDMIDGVHVCG